MFSYPQGLTKQLFIAIKTNVFLSICPVFFATRSAFGLANHAFVLLPRLTQWSIAWWENYCFLVAKWGTSRTMKRLDTGATLSWVSNYSFFIYEFENSVWTEFYAAWLSGFGTTVALIRVNCWKPRSIVTHESHFCFLFNSLSECRIWFWDSVYTLTFFSLSISFCVLTSYGCVIAH